MTMMVGHITGTIFARHHKLLLADIRESVNSRKQHFITMEIPIMLFFGKSLMFRRLQGKLEVQLFPFRKLLGYEQICLKWMYQKDHCSILGSNSVNQWNGLDKTTELLWMASSQSCLEPNCEALGKIRQRCICRKVSI